MDELQLTFMGRPLVIYRNTPLIGWSLHKSVALLAYLAVTGRLHCREELAGLLWPDCTEADARGNLRKVLAELRSRLPSYVLATRAEVAFDRASPYWLDAEALEQTVAAALAPDTGLTEASAAALGQAVELYRDRFLLGLAVHRAPAFEEWVLIEQERLRQLAMRALYALAGYHVARQQPSNALVYLDRLIAVEPAEEEAHRLKMELLAARGDRTAAIHQYLACRHALRALNAEPDFRTLALYERLRGAAALPVTLQALAPSRPPPCRLPTPLLPLVGREAELAEIRARLRDPTCRLLTLVGPGGCGKTHLALEGAAELATAPELPAVQVFSSVASEPLQCSFQDGIFFVPLSSVPGVDALATVLAQTLDVPLSEQVPPRSQLLSALPGKRLLLVLDGFEHLLSAGSLLVDLLRAAPTTRVLVTSRARLDVVGEHLLPVRGLICPDYTPANCDAPASFPAVRLFLFGARQIRPGLQLTDAEIRDVMRICHLVAGLPLAILLAAGWIDILTPAEIAAELEGEGARALDLLRRGDGLLPAPQHSMRDVYDQSWDLLPARERHVMAGLSVLDGSFTVEDAGRAAGASLWELRALLNRSLLDREAGGRYAMDPLLRRYAAEKLAQSPVTAPGDLNRDS